MLTALNNSLADMSRTASNIQNSVMSSYMSASEERAQTDSLYQSVSRSKRDVLDLLAMVNIYEVSETFYIAACERWGQDNCLYRVHPIIRAVLCLYFGC